MKKLAFILLLLLMAAGKAHAETVEDYAGLLGSGTYRLQYSIDYNIKDNGKSNRCLGKGALIKAEGIRLDSFEMDAFHPNEKYPYMFLKIKNLADTTYYSVKAEKKAFKKEAIATHSISRKDKYYNLSMQNLNNYKERWQSEIFSLLGPITEKAGILGVYRVEYLKSGSETHNGKTYSYDEYNIVKPYTAGLRLYYLNGRLAKCIKTLTGRGMDHWLFANAEVTQDGYVVLELSAFDNETGEASADNSSRQGDRNL